MEKCFENGVIGEAMTIKLDAVLPEYPKFDDTKRRAPDRGFRLTKAQTQLALRNALRYVPEELHEKLAPEFLEELKTRGRIYAYRYRPEGRIYGKPIDEYKGNCIEGKAFQVMIDNNLDFEIALYPYELVTYGETGQPCQNWLQYRLIKKYLEQHDIDSLYIPEILENLKKEVSFTRVNKDNEYIVRRLTPQECAKLQGFPSWWCSDIGIDEPTYKDITEWRERFIERNNALGKNVKPKTDNQIRKWLKDPYSESAEYTMWGNGVALPCPYFVLSGIEYFSKHNE